MLWEPGEGSGGSSSLTVGLEGKVALRPLIPGWRPNLGGRLCPVRA